MIDEESPEELMSSVKRTNKDSELEISVEFLAEQARDLLDLTFEGFIINSKGEFVDASAEFYWSTLVNVFDLAVRFRGNSLNYCNLARALLRLSEFKKEGEKEDTIHKARRCFEKSTEIESDDSDPYCLARNYDILGDTLEGEEKIKAYFLAEQKYREHIENEEYSEPDAFYYLGTIIGDRADDELDLKRKIHDIKECVSHFQKAVRLEREDNHYHSALGSAWFYLAEESLEFDKRKRRYNLALKHLKKSNYLCESEELLEEICDIQEIQDTLP